MYTLSNTGFDITLDHSRTSTQYSYGQSVGLIYFSVDQNIDYAASGSYSTVDSEGRMVHFVADLYDETVGSYVFESIQISAATPNESFTLGQTEGDYINTDIGSLTGTLIAGRNYRFYYVADIYAYPSASTSGATASGCISLSFGQGTGCSPARAVPEPTGSVLFCLGLATLMAPMRRSRARVT
jgi:hypothetical protein